ncbi:hypothetical protein G5C66_23675 [Nocardioides sp. KC13]|uniref:Cholesterol esterase n=1 Tax=Nocardioides turkmenicus TaxID=2711220 RepID=A0A6M1R5X1_9ACTN|nr:hypothetical protein [Nocardioides sp. KC13]NGN95724.1 hypothetical protein [Nocardioides sp. KC13]
MNKLGHTSLGRFAAVTLPAAVVSAGMGYAMLSGMVGAVISSTDGFTLSTNLTADALKMRTGATEVGAANNNQGTIYAQTEGSVANGLNVVTPRVEVLPGLSLNLGITSADTSINLGDVALNAASLNTPSGASMANVTLGQSQADAGFDSTGRGYVADGFALQASQTAGQSGEQVLNNLSAQAYAVQLSSLSLDNLSIRLNP